MGPPVPSTEPRSLRYGMSGFTVVWIGQLLSLVGTAMTNFALTIWAFEQTGRATDLALIGFFFMVPLLIFSPVAGAIVDRNNRKLMMMISDLASGVVTIFLLFLFVNDALEIWYLYISAAIMGTFQTFQWPAYSAAISTMLPKEQFGRANGMIALAESGSGIMAPVLAGAVLVFGGMGAIFAIDIFSFSFAIIALLFVHIPQPKQTEAGDESKGSLWSESAFGFKYIWKRPSLLGLQLLFLCGNFFATLRGRDRHCKPMPGRAFMSRYARLATRRWSIWSIPNGSGTRPRPSSVRSASVWRCRRAVASRTSRSRRR